ncbi:MAG: hypothetical protein IPJ26_19140 [Bacteroidetes bacterium]|nr:hypothetical protein [Bacteroidota bacterium]
MAKKKISPINEDFDFKLLVTIARKNLLWFTFFILMAILIALLILRYTAPVYESTAVIQLSEQDNASNVINSKQFKTFTDQNNKLASSIELMRSRVILERVVSKLPFQISYYSKGEILTFELYKMSPFTVELRMKDSSLIGKPINIDFLSSNSFNLNYNSNSTHTKGPFKTDEWLSFPEADMKITIYDYKTISLLQQDLNKDAFYFVINSIPELTSRISKSIVITPLNVDAQTVQIKLKDKTQQKASDIVNGIAIEFNKYDLEKNSEVADKILDFIDNTIASIDIELSNSENSLERFKKENKILNPEMSAGIIMHQLQELQTEIYAYEHEINLYASIRKELQGSPDVSKFLLSLSGRSDNNIILAQLDKLRVLLDQRDQIRLQATEKSELYKSVQVQLENQQLLLNRMLVNEGLSYKAKKIVSFKKYKNRKQIWNHSSATS